MDIKLILTVFMSVFISELGDKTQLAVLGFSAAHRSWLSVLIGGCLALILSTLVAVGIGSLLREYIPLKILRLAGGALFIVIGVWAILKR